MNGYTEMKEVKIWVQMKEACIVELVYWLDSIPEKEFISSPIAATSDQAFIAHLIADNVEPGLTYSYAIYANGENQTSGRELHFHTQELWQWREDPPNFKFALGSCTYVNEPKYDRPGRPYGGDYSIFQSIDSLESDFMLWLGDNVYLREADWFSRTGILDRYTHTRSIPEMQDLLSSTHHYAIWDDHDYGPNDANRTFPHKELTLEAFKLFWANNGYGDDKIGGITSAFQYSDCHFYLLDNRWNRSDPNLKTSDEQVFGKDQIDWLIESLKYSRAPFKFVVTGGQILNTAKVYETYANYESEREELLSRIIEEEINGVIFLTGDRHHTELSRMEENGITIYDLTVSPLTSRTHRATDEGNAHQIEGTLVNERNFGVIEVSGVRKDRKLTISVRSSNGQELWQKSIE